MKRLLAELALILAVVVGFNAAQAAEEDSDPNKIEIITPGGLNLGNLEFKEIAPADALLVVDPEGRNLVGLRAGYIGNSSYREQWDFDNWTLIYDKLPSGLHYLETVFNEREALDLICGPEQECEIIQSDKRSKNLIVVTYRLPEFDVACAGLIYIDEEVYGEGYEGTYGDYFARSIACVPPGGTAEEAVELSAQYLSRVEKDGRPIARLARYKLLQSDARAPAPKPVKEQSDEEICGVAINFDETSNDYGWKFDAVPYNLKAIAALYKAEARRRGFTASECARLLGFVGG
jgi:hypothetical protein